MELLDKLKILLGERSDRYTDDYLHMILEIAEDEALAYTRRDTMPDGLLSIVPMMALVMVNRSGSEGMTSQGFSGVSEGYLDGYPAEVQNILRRYRRIGVIG